MLRAPLHALLRSAALLVVLAAVGAAARTHVAPPPNVLLISIDSLRADHLHTYGYFRQTSPVIDRLAREGVRFDAAISPSSWTLPAHVTLLTATPPELHGLNHPRRRLDRTTVTLAEVLRDRGHATAAFVSGPFLRSLYGYGRGFEVYDETLAQGDREESHRGVTGPELVRRVAAWLDRWSTAEPRRPFFLFVHLWDVHYDYAPPPPYDSMFDPDYAGNVDGTDFENGTQVHRAMAPRDLEHVVALYDGEIRFTDAQIGELVATLERLEVLDDTVVVVTSDHGEEFFDHGQKGHGKALYDETVRVPLVMRYPARVEGGQVVKEQVRLVDVGPTTLGLAGVPIPDDFGSPRETAFREHDLSPWITGARRDFPDLLAFGETSRRPWRPQRFARSATAKHIEFQGQRVERYDLAGDPKERTVLGKKEAPFSTALQAASAIWAEQWSAKQGRAERVELDTELEDQLRALGYLQ